MSARRRRNLVAAVEAADPAVSWVAVAREDLLAVGVLDRFVDRSLPLDLIFASKVRLVILGVVGQHPSSRIVIPDLETVIRVLRRSRRWPDT